MEKRHEGHHHHTVNNKYGHIVLGLTVLNAFSIAVLNLARARLFYSPRLHNSRVARLARILGSISLFNQMLVWASIQLVLSIGPLIYVWAHEHEVPQKTRSYMVKRFGRLAFSMVPFSILLSIRPSPLPETFYLTLLPLHKWISRLLVFLAVAHSVLYCFAWINVGDLHKIWKRANFAGLVACLLYVLIVVCSLKPLRVRFYNVFYFLHTSSVYFTLVLVWYHARPGVSEFAIPGVLLIIYGVVVRCLYSKKVHFRVKQRQNSRLQLVQFPTSVLVKQNKLWSDLKSTTESQEFALKFFSPASHLRISGSLTSWKSWLLSTHPYTIGSISSDETVDLIVKKTNFDIVDSKEYVVSLPYGAVHTNFFRDATDVLIVCGGSGLSFGLSIYKYFLLKQEHLAHNSGINFELVWIIREKSDLFILEELDIIDENAVLKTRYAHFQVYVTNSAQSNAAPNTEKLGFFEKLYRRFTGEASGYAQLSGPEFQDSEAVELESMDNESLASSAGFLDDEFLHQGRPDLDQLCENHLLQDSPNSGSKWLVSCGPVGLIEDCKTWAKNHNTGFISEVFDM